MCPCTLHAERDGGRWWQWAGRAEGSASRWEFPEGDAPVGKGRPRGSLGCACSGRFRPFLFFRARPLPAVPTSGGNLSSWSARAAWVTPP